jgi:hypothetical protein
MHTLSTIYATAQAGKVYADAPVFDPAGRYRRLTEDVTFLLSNGKVLTIQKGFEWDENSIPFILQPLFPKSGIYAIPALIHDALYYMAEGEQKFADMEFAIWMCALRIKPKQIAFRLWAVDTFGDRWWNKNLCNPGERCLNNRTKIHLS